MNQVIPNPYAEMVAKLAKPGDDIVRDLTGERAHCWHMASCIMGEAGELFDAVKKPAIYGKGQYDIKNVIEELGDMEFYMEGLRQRLGITREQTLQANTEKLLTGKDARYKSGIYSNEQALARADKETTMPPVHHESVAEPADFRTVTTGFAQTVPPKSAEGTSPMEQPGALSPAGAQSPSPDVQANQGSTRRIVTDAHKQAVEQAHEKVVAAQAKYNAACEALWKDPRHPTLRRVQQQAFSQLSAAQFELEQAFDGVPPRKDL